MLLICRTFNIACYLKVKSYPSKLILASYVVNTGGYKINSGGVSNRSVTVQSPDEATVQIRTTSRSPDEAALIFTGEELHDLQLIMSGDLQEDLNSRGSFEENLVHNNDCVLNYSAAPIPATIPSPTPIPETDPEPFEHTFEEPSPVHQHFSPPQEQAQGQMAMDDLLQVVPQLISRIDSLETDLKQTKLTMGNAIVKLVKKVKKLEGLLKKRHVVLSDSEEEEPEAQGRKSQDDPLDSSVQGLVTPSTTKVNASGEEQVEDISPNTLEAAKTLSKVASLKPRSIDKGRRYKRRKEAKGKKVVSSLDFQEEVDTGAEQVNTAEGVNTGSIKLSTVSEQLSTGSEQVSTVSAKKSTSSHDKGQREGKAPMISEETPKKSKEKFDRGTLKLKRRRIKFEQTKEKEEPQFKFEAQHYTDEDWDLIRAKIEANAELSKSVLGSGLQGEDFAKKMNQGTWKLSQLKNLSFEEVKEEFDKLIARKGLHFEKTDEDESEAGKDTDPISGTNISVNPVPVAMKTPKYSYL
ncbi:hypothetical protein Tco_0800165 [Tanacetum coccineum]|uniref:Uncharacterized protein n=1 Tax=Tanacetum coccineum TaxID=301880 RepID=A0ABQ4ZTD8_9ASTR